MSTAPPQPETKKRKMEDGSATSGGAEAVAADAASTHGTAAAAAAVPSDADATMRPEDDADAGEGDVSQSASASISPEELASLTAQLPATLSLLSTLTSRLDVCRLPPFKHLRKSVLRLSSALQEGYFGGETKDEATKRMHYRKKKSEAAARELKQKMADQAYINSVALRNARIQALNALVEPEGWGEKKGDQLLLPAGAESERLLLTSSPDEPSASPPQPSMSPSISPGLAASSSAAASALQPSPEAYARAAGPQAYTYPTVAAGSKLAEMVGAQTEPVGLSPASQKPYVKGATPAAGASQSTVVTVTAAAVSSVVVPPLPTLDDESAALLSKTQQKKAGLGPTGRAAKKAMFGQEGVHVNKEVLEGAKKQEQAGTEKQPQQQDVEMADASTVPASAAPATAASSGASSTTPLSSAEAASRASDPVSGSINGQPEFGPVLNNPRSCYCCKARFYQLHFFYSEFCGPCARLNYAKRNQLADLRGKVILLTGSRVKIGFRCGLRLLRCGATLIATSRFPHDTAKRYAEEKDFAEWKDRLHIYGLDLRDLKSVVKLADILNARYARLDAIINNAAQTVRRPPMYYRHLLPIECLSESELPQDWREVVKGDFHEMAGRARLREEGTRQQRIEEEGGEEIEAGGGGGANTQGGAKSGVTVEDISHVLSDALPIDAAKLAQEALQGASTSATAASTAPAAATSSAAASSSSSSTSAPIVTDEPTGDSDRMDVFQRSDDLNASLLTTSNRAAALSQLAVLPGDQHQDAALFPANRFDVTGQQLDLRKVNSWNLTLDQVDPSELVEVFAINALSPFILNSRLKGLMLKGGAHPQFGPSVQVTDKYIINVSAMEGKFYRHKSPYHPHTNAAKAALNMLTRTSAQDYAKDRIYMNSVDTGWINDENPYETAKRLYKEHNWQTPIDEEDAMARILDPLLTGVATGINCFGKFFKDYHESEW